MTENNNSSSRGKAAGSVRLPVSCEPCRKRKIKCSRSRPPCDTCRRRQCSESCIYLGTRDIPEANRDLLARIDTLEEMLRKHAQSSQQSPPFSSGTLNSQGSANVSTQAMLSPPIEWPQQQHGGAPSLPLTTTTATSQASVASFSPRTPGQIGTLTSNESGDVQYEPYAAQWTAVLANTGITAPILEDCTEDDGCLGFPFSASPAPSREDLIASLPPVQQCNYLKSRYFDVFSPLFHILHDPTFHEEYDKFVSDPSSQSLSWLAILFVILSLAVTSLEEEDPIVRDIVRGSDPANSIRILSRRYRETAMKCLAKQGVFWGKHNLHSLQALIMLGYAMSHSQQPTWVLLGMTYNVAIALACHIDPSNFDMNPIQSEQRRRCWAGLMMLYTIQNVFLGNPDPFRLLSNHAVQLPADANDIDITETEIRGSGTGPTQVSYLLFKFQLYNLTTSICSEVFSNNRVSRETMTSLDQQICLAQESWDARYASDSNTFVLPNNHKMHLHILHAYAHQLFLLLHRPFFAQSIIGLDIPNESQLRCIASAEALLDIHKLIHETPEYKPFLWYSNGLGSFHAFHAAVVLAVALLMPIYKPQYKKFKEILNDTARRFKRLESRSPICKRASKVLQLLLQMPSPNQPNYLQFIQASTTQTRSLDDMNSDWSKENAEQLQFFAERLQPQQWLGPSSMAWGEWDDFLGIPIEGM